MSGTKHSGGAAIIDACIANGVDTIFGLPGAQIYALFDAVHARGLRLVVPRHEQTAGYMAMGYAKSTGRAGVCCVVPGPGVLNASAALATAMGNCSPVVCLTGQIPSEFLGRGRGHLHELPDQPATLRSIIKDAVRIDDPRETSRIVNGAFRTALSGRPGPVAIEMCWDTMAAPTDAEIGPGAGPIERAEPDPERIEAAADLVAAAARPMIMCGAGAQHASEEVLALAEALNAPVTAFRSGRGVVPEDHPLAAPPVAARDLWDEVDLLIGIGSRLEMPYLRWRDPMRYERRPAHGPKLLRIDVDPGEMKRLVPDVAVVGDAALASRRLADVLARRVAPDPARRERIAAAKARAGRALKRLQPQARYLEVIRDVVPRDGFLVPELSQVGFATYTGAYPVLAPRTYVSEGFQGTLGFGFPTALGVKAAHPDRVVVSICGDGGFLFAVQELATAAQHDLGVAVVVFNNDGYANVLRDQREQYGGRVLGSEFDALDYVRIAESFGVEGFRARSPEELDAALAAVVESGRPAVVEVIVPKGGEASPWEFIHMRERPRGLD